MKNLFQRRGYRGLIFLTLTGLLSSPQVNAEAASELVGDWMGTVNTEFESVRLVFHVRDSSAGMSITMDSPDQGAVGIPATIVCNDPAAIKFEVSVADATYEGALSDDGKTIEGTWSQQGNSTAVSLALQEGLEQQTPAAITKLFDFLASKLLGG
ncbi:MAG: hypothetical protein IIC60_13090 [Proteobacteria bacterium]|nr:hypothetical protein [Pseudomonadota bacterium]